MAVALDEVPSPAMLEKIAASGMQNWGLPIAGVGTATYAKHPRARQAALRQACASLLQDKADVSEFSDKKPSTPAQVAAVGQIEQTLCAGGPAT